MPIMIPITCDADGPDGACSTAFCLGATVGTLVGVAAPDSNVACAGVLRGTKVGVNVIVPPGGLVIVVE